MGDVLTQTEVEALLSALDQQPAAKSQAIAPANELVPLPDEINLYDFKRPERVSKDHMRALQTIHEGFGRSLSASLSGFLRTIVDVKLVSCDQLTYSEFIFSLENPTCFNVLTCAPLDGYMVLETNPSIVYPIIDRLLGGGRGDVLIPRRPLTEIEIRLVHQITNRAIEGLRAVWSQVLPIDFKADRIESNPQLVYIVPPNEVIVLISFELAIGDLRGMMNLCIPFNVIEPVVDKLSTNTWFSYAKKGADKSKDVQGGLSSAPISLVVHLGETSITAEQLMDLRVGDLLPIEKSIKSGLLVTMGGKPKFRGTPFTMKNRKVLRIDRRAEKNARINN